MNTNKTKKKLSASRRETVVTISVTSLILAVFLILNFAILPFLDARAAMNISPKTFLRAYGYSHNRADVTYTYKEYTAMDILLHGSAASPEEMKSSILKSGISMLKFHEGNTLDLSEVTNFTSLEYIKELNDRYFYILLKSKNTKEETVYYCLFFEYLKDSDNIYTYSGVTVCIQPTLRSASFLEERGFSNDVRVMPKEARIIRRWYERIFECEYPYLLKSETKDDVRFTSLTHHLTEYHLLSDGIAKITTNSNDYLSDQVKTQAVISYDQLLFDSGEELAALFDELRALTSVDS